MKFEEFINNEYYAGKLVKLYPYWKERIPKVLDEEIIYILTESWGSNSYVAGLSMIFYKIVNFLLDNPDTPETFVILVNNTLQSLMYEKDVKDYINSSEFLKKNVSQNLFKIDIVNINNIKDINYIPCAILDDSSTVDTSIIDVLKSKSLLLDYKDLLIIKGLYKNEDSKKLVNNISKKGAACIIVSSEDTLNIGRSFFRTLKVD